MSRALKASLFIALALSILGSTALLGQGPTSASIRGKVLSTSGDAIPGATVTAVHEPTRTQYTSISTSDGTFAMLSVRVGGPYTVSAVLEGFATQTLDDQFAGLGETVTLEFRLPLETVSETITVTSSSALINPSRTGSTSNVPEAAIETLPTIGRGLEDFTRTNPFFTVAQSNEDPQSISVVGRSGRYNNIQIDGAVNNDLFGLAAQGTPGGQADTTPISLDAIQELQLLVTPFDVRQGGFSGGGVNAITRSGTNSLKASVFYFTRDDGLVGDGPDRLGEFGTFEDDQYGFRLGGPVSRDKLFFFVNGEFSERKRPSGFSIDGAQGTAFGGGNLVAEAQAFRQALIDRYGFDPGGLSQQTIETPSDKLFGRLDWNVNGSNTVTFRHNFVDAENDVNRPSSTNYEWPSETYLFQNETNSTVVQWNSAISGTMFNELRLVNQKIEDRRAGKDGIPFPWVEIENVIPGSGLQFQAGTEQFSTFNSLDQDIFELTNDFTWLRGNHSFVFGTHNEFFSFDNLFIQNGFGAYEFSTLDDFLQNRPARRFQYTIVNPGRNPSQKFDVEQLGFYAGDEWRARPNLTIQYGVRVDIPFFPDEPSRNPDTETLYGFRTDELPDGNEIWSPRLGFNWDISGDGSQQLRGGVGIFSGRTPYVWVSNNFAATGIEQTRLTAFNVPFVADPFNQPVVGSGTSGEFNLIDPDFNFPTSTRYSLGYDRRLPWGLIGSVEFIHSDSIDEIDYKDVNLVQTDTLPFDGRPFFGARVDPSVTGAFLITNTSQGETTSWAVKVERPFRDNFSWSASWAHGESKSVNDGTSSRAVSNYQFNESIDPNNAELARSEFEVEERFNVAASYLADWGGSKWATTFGLFYNLQSGRPYSFIYGFQSGTPGGINGDFYFSNDLLYVPAGPNDVVITNGTWDQLDAFIRSEPCLDSSRGSIAPRNCATAPWSHSLDLQVLQDIPLGNRHRLQLSATIENLVNLLDEDSGTVEYVPFSTLAPVSYSGFTADGLPIYGLNAVITNPNVAKYTTHNILSRWRAKLGVRWSF